ncbi:MAG: hypothetical protein EOP56_15140 [Sphingobacteriales bacterium]|nr:MAG: hypothetical protein EOP56_15140 [Sphingobacteriales bacterium]
MNERPPIILKHDGLFDIAIGKNRHEKNWQNKQMLLSDLFIRLQQTHKTPETIREYLAAPKSRQDEIKDIGGFVGGYLQNGKRKKDHVAHRQLVTLDLDFAEPDIWGMFELIYGYAAAMYSTHKHTEAKPRLRLVMPLDREVYADEYVAIARRIAGDLGIEQFDNTGFQPERLMYWPSTPKDVDYYFKHQDGPWLSADQVLSTYHDWRDSSEWPVSEQFSAVIQNAIKKQGDPLEKTGVIGAFCRAYTIQEAIEKFLFDVYAPCDMEGRYTYIEGSTAGGLVIYEDKFAFSHHGTDPTSNKLCNAFDLVRIHKFGNKDDNTSASTPANKRPSFIAMQDFATSDKDVKRVMFSEREAQLKDDFADEFPADDEEAEEDNSEWKSEKLEVNRQGIPYATIDNLVNILENDTRLKGRFKKDIFSGRELIIGRLPWRNDSVDTYIKDSDIANLKYRLKLWHSIVVTSALIEDALQVVYQRNSFHAVRDYLNSLVWDQQERIDTLLIDYLGAKDTEYTRHVTRKAIVAAVARVFRPGCKFDNMLVLVGEQGIGKSTILNRLGRQWFSDSFNFHMLKNGKEAPEQIQGAWLVEIGELAGLRKTEVESAKSFLSKQEDRFRMSYGRRLEYFPRQCVFFGTTNNREFLQDVTGNRRFWPVDTKVQPPIKSVFTDLTEDEIGQVWAEALYLYKHNEPLHLSPEIEELAAAEQQEHAEWDDRTGEIQQYLDTLLPDPETWRNIKVEDRQGWYRGGTSTFLTVQEHGTHQRNVVSVSEIWREMLQDRQPMSKANTKHVHTILQQLGWKQQKNPRYVSEHGRQRVYVRPKGQLVQVQKSDNNDQIFTDNNAVSDNKPQKSNRQQSNNRTQ